MTFDLDAIISGKHEYRARLAALPIEEKLALLDALRERALVLRGNVKNETTVSGMVREDKAPYDDPTEKPQFMNSPYPPSINLLFTLGMPSHPGTPG